jgi:inorganic pyrophosphatase
MNKQTNHPINAVEAFNAKGGLLNVIIDTPKNSRNKYTYDPEIGLFKLGGVLAAGHSFPYDFGFIPKTKGGDGDPVDVLVLMDEPGFVGLWVEARLIGGWEAYQTERDGRRERNDRLVAVSKHSLIYKELQNLDDLNKTLAGQIVHFFVSYNEAKGKHFEAAAKFGASDASETVRKFLDGR